MLLMVAGWGANQFSPLLGAYRGELGLSPSAATGLLALYVVGLVPGLLFGGPLADRRGRKPVVIWAIVLNAVATVALMLGAHVVPWLAVGRLLVGLSTGAVLAAGSAWVRDLSHPPFGTATEDGAGARRAGVLLAAGFSISGLVSALVATWGPLPLVSAYLPHLVLCAVTLPAALRCPETRAEPVAGAPRGRGVRDPRFLRRVVPVAPWIFLCPTVGFAVLPAQVTTAADQEVLYAGISTLCAPGFGAVVQPWARRLARRGVRATAVVGLVTIAAGLVLAAVAAWQAQPWLGLIAALTLGTGYGFVSTYCLTVVGRIAAPSELAGLTAIMWVLAYLGFCTPFVVSLLSGVVAVPVVLLVLAGLALLTLLSARDEPDGDRHESRRAQRVQRLRDSGVL
ncbi:MFS transporter [Saccharopolyspora rhizosphaerae]|uniref:MFS transporter n=1 Tax=Saccharopolyspora rhizosphaerae TaxID=2492662 RepID=A0A426JT69_9PSEU|nr:MFS transporter [Saccharopolyspora rhizosphaerae]